MSMSPQGARGAIRSEINVTPLVDVCLVLLIIFMVVTPILQAGVKVDVPKTSQVASLPGDDRQLQISIDQDGTVYVRKSRVESSRLVATLGALHEAQPDLEVIVRADRTLSYETVSEVLTLVSSAGFGRVGLITQRRQAG